ncbi:MAG: hypothetical protein ACREQ2_20175 [Candidatus Binatia bacterium]
MKGIVLRHGRDLAPLHELSQATADPAHRMNHHPWLEVIAPVDDHVAVDVPF